MPRRIRCSECGEEHGPYPARQSSACPNCGSRRGQWQPCDDCPAAGFEAALEASGRGELFRIALDLDRLKEARILPDWNELRHDEWLALSVLTEERARYENERLERSSQPAMKLTPPPRTH